MQHLRVRLLSRSCPWKEGCIALSKGSTWQDAGCTLFLEVQNCRALMCISMRTNTAISCLARSTEWHYSCHPYKDIAEPSDPMIHALDSHTCQQIVCCAANIEHASMRTVLVAQQSSAKPFLTTSQADYNMHPNPPSS